jgi:ElaB/YqjD/DUF883 family membrane-anchored ribosome-binding protein
MIGRAGKSKKEPSAGWGKQMMGRKSLRDELDELRAEMARLKQQAPEPQSATAVPAAEPVDATLMEQLSELNRLAQERLEEAEDIITEHPVAAVAGALALGIIIGRLTAR